MTVAAALQRHGISKGQWQRFLNAAVENATPPPREKHELTRRYKDRVRSWLRSEPAWAYVGGMKDALWAWVEADRAAYDVLEAVFLKKVGGMVRVSLGGKWRDE